MTMTLKELQRKLDTIKIYDEGLEEFVRLGAEKDGDNYNIYYYIPEYQIVNIPSYIRGAIDSSFQGFEALTEEQQRKVLGWAIEFSLTAEKDR